MNDSNPAINMILDCTCSILMSYMFLHLEIGKLNLNDWKSFYK
jgi:hypothetical protein